MLLKAFKLLGILLLVTLGVSVFCPIPGVNFFKARRIAAQVQQVGHVGASRKVVEGWLDAQQLEHSFVDAREYDLGFSSTVRDAKIAPGTIGGMSYSMIRSVSWRLLIQTDLQIVCIYGKDDKLLRLIVEEVSTGP